MTLKKMMAEAKTGKQRNNILKLAKSLGVQLELDEDQVPEGYHRVATYFVPAFIKHNPVRRKRGSNVIPFKARQRKRAAR